MLVAEIDTSNTAVENMSSPTQVCVDEKSQHTGQMKAAMLLTAASGSHHISFPLTGKFAHQRVSTHVYIDAEKAS